MTSRCQSRPGIWSYIVFLYVCVCVIVILILNPRGCIFPFILDATRVQPQVHLLVTSLSHHGSQAVSVCCFYVFVSSYASFSFSPLAALHSFIVIVCICFLCACNSFYLLFFLLLLLSVVWYTHTCGACACAIVRVCMPSACVGH